MVLEKLNNESDSAPKLVPQLDVIILERTGISEILRGFIVKTIPVISYLTSSAPQWDTDASVK